MEELELLITDVSRSGPGVARDDQGRVIFVPLTAPGDRVRVRITRVEKRYAQGELVEVLEASPQRVTPPCSVFGRCGGCQWQHLSYELQWKTKSGGVRHALERVQVPIPGAMAELRADRIWEYRNRVQLRGQGRELGFFARGSNDLVPVDRCEIARPEINAAWEETRRQGAEKGKPFKAEVEVLDSGEIRRTWNSPHGAAGFRQVHDEQNAKLRDFVSSALPDGVELFDLYGGSGNFALPLASRMGHVHCVDVSSPEQAPAGTPANLTFHRSAVLPWLLRRYRTEGRKWPGTHEQAVAALDPKRPRAAILDPPREGLAGDAHEILCSIEALGISRIVAVGCDVDSWARDVSKFVRRGWTLESVATLDLFPQTPHVESIAVLRV